MQESELSHWKNEFYELWPAMVALSNPAVTPVIRATGDDDCAYHNVATCPDCGGGLLRLGTCCTCPSCGLEACGI